MIRLIVLFVFGLAACAVQRNYGYVDGRTRVEAALPPVQAEVISADDAARAGLTGNALVVPFGGDARSADLVSGFLAQADAARARKVSGLAVILASTQDGQAIECRTEIVPETVTESQWRPPRTERVQSMKPVSRQVTEWEQKCHQSTRLETEWYTDYEDRCQYVRKPVHRTRTVYRSAYDYYSKSYRSQPQTERYTDYENVRECRREMVRKSRMVNKPHRECHSAPVTRTVTRYEWQYENRYVPGYLDTWSRQRLRELEPVCYAAESAVGNRVEGVLHTD